jgi:hypothetical protein
MWPGTCCYRIKPLAVIAFEGPRLKGYVERSPANDAHSPHSGGRPACADCPSQGLSRGGPFRFVDEAENILAD